MGLGAQLRIGAAALFACAALGCTSFVAHAGETGSRMTSSAKDFADRLKAQSEAQISDYDRRLESWQPQLKEYAACNRSASRIISNQQGDPLSLALAARNICRSEEAILRNSIDAAYSDNPFFGTEAMEKMRKKVLENNIGDIVAYRAKANSNSAPRRPKVATPGSGI